MERKQQIRAELKEKRNVLTRAQREEYSRKICENLRAFVKTVNPKVIYFYYPLGSEVNLLPLAEEFLKEEYSAEAAVPEGRVIAFPRTCGDTMEFYPVTSLSDFVEGRFHIMEPMGELPLTEPEPLVVVPGLGFDRQGNRMGYGKGFYDRYFARFPSCRKMGAAFETQIVEEIPAQAHDIIMDFVVTEKGVLNRR